MRTLPAMLVCLLVAIPAFAADLPITCKMVDRAGTARLLGAPLGEPTVYEQIVCTGLCASYNPIARCTFPVANPKDSGRTTSFAIDLDLPPFRVSNWPEITRNIEKWDRKALVEDLSWRDGVAIWTFHPNYNVGVLNVFIGRRRLRAHLGIVLDGIGDNAVALSDARAMAAHALTRLERATPGELPGRHDAAGRMQ